VLFEVSPAVYQHLLMLVVKSGLGETSDEVAKSLFTIEAQLSMKNPERHTVHPDAWFIEVAGASPKSD
jgi:hypothetical protein